MITEQPLVKKPHDWFVVNLLNPSADLSQLKLMEFSPENTGFQDQTSYKENEKVQSYFLSEDGKFDEVRFQDYYNDLLAKYNDLEFQQYKIEDFQDNLIASKHDYLASPKATRRQDKVYISEIFNPTNSNIGVYSPGIWSSDVLSMREVAQTQNVKTESSVDLGYTPNDKNKRGFFDFNKDLFFGDGPLVLAQWEEDGEHEDLFYNVVTPHKKGDLKYNEFGKPYYETLGKRTAYNKQLLSVWDTLTVEGTRADDYNFMSADDKKKSFGGYLQKAAARVTPYAIPGVGQVYQIATAQTVAAEFLPQIGKMIGSFLQGEEFRKTDVYQYLNLQESKWSAFNNFSVSDHSMGKIWTWENLFNLIPEVFIQLKQQRAIGNIPKWLNLTSADAKQLNRIKNTKGVNSMDEVKHLWDEAAKMGDPGEAFLAKQMQLLQHGDKDLYKLYATWIKNQNKLAKGLAVGYMTGASTGEIDAVIDEFDLGARDGAWMKLGVLAAFWFSMSNTSFGDWAVKYAIGLDDAQKFLKSNVRTAQNEFIENTYGKMYTGMGKEVEKSFLASIRGASPKDIFRKGYAMGEKIMEKVNSKPILKNMTKESLEEMSEETFTDSAKGIYNIFFNLNLTSNKEKKVDWENDNWLSRYAMQGIGGALGGAMFQVSDMFNQPFKEQQKGTDFYKSTVNAIVNGNAKEVYAQIDGIKNSRLGFASKNLSFSMIEKKLENNEIKKIFAPSNKDRLSQNDVIATLLTNQVQSIEKALQGDVVPSMKVLQDVYSNRAQTLIDFDLHTALRDDAVKIGAEYVELVSQYDGLMLTAEKSNETQQRDLKDLNLKIQSKLKQLEDLQSPETIGKYYKEALWAMDKSLHTAFLTLEGEKLDPEEASQSLYQKNYIELTDEEKAKVENVEQLPKREKLRLSKIIFEQQAKLIQKHILPVNELFNSKKDLIDLESRIHFGEVDFEQENIDSALPDNVGQQFRTEGFKFLDDSFHLDENLSVEKDTISFNFLEYWNALYAKFKQSPESLTREEFSLLKVSISKILDNNISSYSILFSKPFGLAFLQTLNEDSFDGLGAKISLKAAILHSKGLDKEGHYSHINKFKESDLNAYNGTLFDYNPVDLLSEYYRKTDPKKNQIFNTFIDSMAEYLNDQKLSQSNTLTAIELFLKDIDVTYKSEKNNLLDLLERERNKLIDRPLSEYVLQSQVTLREIQKTKALLERLQVLLYSYTNFSLDPDTQIGYFPAINQYNKKNGIQEDYSQLEVAQTFYINKYINDILVRLDFLENLSIYNINSKIPNKEKAEMVTNVKMFRAFLNFMKKNNIDIPEDAKIEVGQELTDEEFKTYALELKTSDIKDLLQNIYKAEHSIFEWFSMLEKSEAMKVVTTLQTTEVIEGEKAKNIIKDDYRTNFRDNQGTKYSRFDTKVQFQDNLYYALSTFLGDSYKFAEDFTKTINTYNLDFVLFGDQTYAIKMAHQFLQQKNQETFGITSNVTFDEVFGILTNGLKNNVLFESNEKITVPVLFSHIFNIQGIAGSGKTALLDFLSRMIQDRGINMIALSETQSVSNILFDKVPLSLVTNPEIQNLESFFNTIFGKENYKQLKQESLKPIKDINKKTDEDLITFDYRSEAYVLGLNPTNALFSKIEGHVIEAAKELLKVQGKNVSLIQVDESSQIDFAKSYFLQRYVEAYNKLHPQNQISVIYTGDYKQPGSYVKTEENIIGGNVFSTTYVRAPELSSSIRTQNNLQDFNAVQLDARAELEYKRKNDQGSKLKLTLKYGFKENKLYGAKAVNYSKDSHESMLEKLLAYADNKPSNIAVVTNRENENLIALQQKHKVDVYFEDNFNGIEYDYVLVDLNLESLKSSIVEGTGYINGQLTRSRKGTFFNDNLTTLFAELENVEDFSVFDIFIPPDKIQKFKEKRIQMFNAIHEGLTGEKMEVKEKRTLQKKSRTNSGGFNITGKEEVIATSPASLIGEFQKRKEEEDVNHGTTILQHYNQVTRNANYKEDRIHQYENKESGEAKVRKLRYNENPEATRLINSFAKTLQTSMLYEGLKPQDQKAKMLNFIQQKVSKDIDDFTGVLYRHNQKLIFAIRFTYKGGEQVYLTFGDVTASTQGTRLIDSFGDHDYLEVQDFEIEDGKTISILAPYTNGVDISREKDLPFDEKSKISELEAQGFVVSPVYMAKKGKDGRIDVTEQASFRSGKEFVFVSLDNTLNANQLKAVFMEELGQSQINRPKKDKTNIDQQTYGTSNGRVRLMFLDPKAFEFKEWFEMVSKQRQTSDMHTLRAIGDGYITSRIFQTLFKEQVRLSKAKELTPQEKTFQDFVHNFVKIISVIHGKDIEAMTKVLEKQLSSKSKESIDKILKTVNETLVDHKGWFKQDHLFLQIFHSAIGGGTVYIKEGETTKTFKIEPGKLDLSDTDEVKQIIEIEGDSKVEMIKEYIDNIIKNSDGFGSDRKTNKGIYYNASFKKNSGETEDDWQYEQDLSSNVVNEMYRITPLYDGSMIVPLNIQEYEKKRVEVIKPEETVEVKSPTQEVVTQIKEFDLITGNTNILSYLDGIQETYTKEQIVAEFNAKKFEVDNTLLQLRVDGSDIVLIGDLIKVEPTSNSKPDSDTSPIGELYAIFARPEIQKKVDVESMNKMDERLDKFVLGIMDTDGFLAHTKAFIEKHSLDLSLQAEIETLVTESKPECKSPGDNPVGEDVIED